MIEDKQRLEEETERLASEEFLHPEMKKQVKICGMTCVEDIMAANQYQPDFVGFVLFFPKSKRNLPLEKAADLRKQLFWKIKSVAVTVSPTVEQVEEIEKNGFDYIQIHGSMTKAVYDRLTIPVLRAFNGGEKKQLEEMRRLSKIKGYVFDAKDPGSGKTFDWNLLKQMERDEKLWFLAGGIHENNVKEAIYEVQPDGIDVSSAVEWAEENRRGKDPEKMKKIIRMVHNEE